MLGNSIQLKGWNNTPEIREVLGRSVGFAFSDFEGILHASQMVNFLWKIHEATKVSTCDEPKSVHDFRLLSHQHQGHPTKHWTSLECNCWSYLNLDIDSWYSWDPTLAPFTPPCSRPTKPWDKSWQLVPGGGPKRSNSHSINHHFWLIKSLKRWIAKFWFNHNSIQLIRDKRLSS